jgi:hypothetical protein
VTDDDRILDSYQRAGVPLPGLRRARVIGDGLPVWVVQPLPPEREPFVSWRRLRAAHAQTGLWPFLAGMDLKEVDRQALSELWYQAATEHGPTAVQRGLALGGPSSPSRRQSLRRPTRRRWPWMRRRWRGLSASRSLRSPPATR